MTKSATGCWHKAALAAAAAGFLFCAGAAHAQSAAGYMRVVTAQGMLDGSSKDPAHMNWIVVSSVVAADLDGDTMADRESSAPSVSELTATHAAVAPRESASGLATGRTASGAASNGAASSREMASGMATGKRMHKPLTIMKEMDKSSPMLAQACATGQHLKEVDVALASKPGGFYKLSDVLISSDQKSGSGERPTETVSFTYQKIEWTH